MRQENSQIARENPASEDDAGTLRYLEYPLSVALVEGGRLSATDAERAVRLRENQQSDQSIGTILLQLGLVSDRDLAVTLATLCGVPVIEKKAYPDLAHISENISSNFLKQHRLVVFEEQEDHLVAIMVDPTDRYVIDALELISGKQIRLVIGIASEIDEVIQTLFSELMKEEGGDDDGGTEHQLLLDDVEQLKELASEAPVIKMVNQIIQRAVSSKASDIHIEPFENSLKIRYRVDGLLRDTESTAVNLAPALISRIKIMANLNIAERRLPQDGRFKVRVHGATLDMRVSTVPTLHGESMVLRLLQRDHVNLDFASLGFDSMLEQRLLEILDRPHGIVVVTGPTGSGKTTSLYAALNYLNRPERKILTVEDPVEYNIEGVNQIQVKPNIGLNFSSALRSIVRQDPDIIMIGEIRDQETAQIAVQSALTGHLVLSSLHTNDAAGSITRFIDMGIEPFLLTSTVNAVVAQRLVRNLCPDCKQPYDPPPEVAARFESFPGGATLYKAVGCEHCSGSGYRGRSAIIEMIELSEGLRSLILQGGDKNALAECAKREGARSMYEDGLLKVMQGITTLEEVLRVTQEN
ncbi:MAG: type II secretion system protein GspE [gamma proteobacterium symbiont of Ctena orbiculata]|nr:MAG: type II secretion system protein GspE [gamma proteobacterium symbiont of Ctena orbiculata]PVV24453.1 MAG: type II secretion system protein GspE [gamma proteobacterium symbiont of Ctena orbiculata]